MIIYGLDLLRITLCACSGKSSTLLYYVLQKTPMKDTLCYHPDIPDMVAILTEGPRTDLVWQRKRVIVGVQCGNSVLRGADVYAPGVLGAPKSMMSVN